MSSSSKEVSEPTISSAECGWRTAIFPMALMARRDISASTSVTYSLSSDTIGSAVLKSPNNVKMSILMALMYEGSLYRQKNCLKSAWKTSVCSGPRAISACTCTSTVYASSGVGAAINVNKGPLSRRRTSICSSKRLLVRSMKILVTESTTALLDCFSKLSRMFMMSNISPSSSTWYFARSFRTAHCPHSEKWFKRFNMFVIISFVGWKPPSSAVTSSTAEMALATTCASLSCTSRFKDGSRSESSTADLEMWNTFTTPTTAVLRT
mmetsp:Transcript_78246/g.239315  ORF Transcript_78246/g.239315 Transcript_78246/m.239315 type:complete len:266 (+) Transcript_78246:673-1470(+)